MTTQTLARLRQLKLPGMAAALQTQLEQVGTYEELSFLERITLLVEQETLSREQHKHQRLIRQARFKLNARVADIDYQHPGKTYVGCALGHSACLKGYRVRYYRLSRLLLELTQARADGSYHKQLQQLAKVQLLIIDDWGLEPLKPAQRNDLLEIMDDRHGNTATMMISQLPTDQWYASIGDNTLADAILDRLMHNAHRLALKGESMRKALSQLTDDEQVD
jgi:DNA replication protein DnaC